MTVPVKSNLISAACAALANDTAAIAARIFNIFIDCSPLVAFFFRKIRTPNKHAPRRPSGAGSGTVVRAPSPRLTESMLKSTEFTTVFVQ